MKMSITQSGKQHGFTMLEVLISVLVLSIGLLGLAGLQANALRNNNGSYFRTQASLLAYEMADRMRSNIQGVNAGAYNGTPGNPLDTNSGFTAPGCVTGSGCTPAQMATNDLAEWETVLESTLPSGRGQVGRVGSSNTFTITVMWDELRRGATTPCPSDSTTAFDPDVHLTCIRFTFSP